MKKVFILSLFFILIILVYIKIELDMHHIVDISILFKISIVIIISMLLYILKKDLLYLFLPITVLIVLFRNNLFFIILYNLFVVYISYRITMLYRKEVIYFLLMVLFLNIIFIFIEIHGIMPSLAYYQTYTNDIYGYRSNLMETGLPIAAYQCRPHGIYSSTILLSYILININAILLFHLRNMFIVILTSIASIFAGGTALLLSTPIVFILLYLMKRYTLNYFIKSIIVYFIIMFLYWYFYTALFDVNYEFSAILMSFYTRFDMNSAHSTLTSFFYPTLVFFVILIFWLIYKMKSVKIDGIYLYIYMFTPLLISLVIHPLLASTRLYILLGIILSLSLYIKKNNLKLKGRT